MSQNCNCHGSGGENSQTVAAILERPRYSPGLILEDSDLTSAVDYTRSLSRLLFRNLFGCGVICGLSVKVDRECGLNVTVSPGLALDGCGDPVQLPSPVTIAYDKRKDEQLSKAGSAFWVILCGKEKLCQPRALVCEADDYDGVTQATRIRALSEVSISFEEPKCVCGCPPAPEAQAAPADAAATDAATGAASSGGTAQAAPGTDPCHVEHYTRVDCAEDCGCGTACDCGCCILLAKASFAVSADAPDGAWTVQHKGVRRFVRAALVPDPGGPGEKPPAPAPVPLVEPAPAPPAPEEKIVAQPAPPPPPQPEDGGAEPVDPNAATADAAKAVADAAAAAAASAATKPVAPS